MELKQSSEKALDKWLAGHWHTGNEFDINKFYDFVNQYIHDHGHIINEKELNDIICSKVKINPDEKTDLNNIIWDNVFLIRNILDFLKHTGR